MPPRNASSPIASDRQDEPLTTPDPPTPSSSACSTEYVEEISDDALVVACRKLRGVLRAHYANTKPPGDLFEPFIQKWRKRNHCRLCPKVLGNREQMNQHVMKDHCGHRPFACPVQGWCVRIYSLCAIGYRVLTLDSPAITETPVLPIYENILKNIRMCGYPAQRGKYIFSMGDKVAHSHVIVAKSHLRINETSFAIFNRSIRNSSTSLLLVGHPVGELAGTELFPFYIANTRHPLLDVDALVVKSFHVIILVPSLTPVSCRTRCDLRVASQVFLTLCSHIEPTTIRSALLATPPCPIRSADYFERK